MVEIQQSRDVCIDILRTDTGKGLTLMSNLKSADQVAAGPARRAAGEKGENARESLPLFLSITPLPKEIPGIEAL